MIPKFRAYDTKNKVMVTNFHRSHMKIETGKVLYQLNTTNENEIKAIASYNTFDDYIYRYSHDLELMQSTGLKDKNDVEIFEGDIVLENGIQRAVSFGEQEYEEDFGNLAYYVGFNVYTKWGYSSIDPVEYEILGNIYENQELLEAIE